MNDFLPKGYQTPESERRYMEFAEGQNTFRILSSAIVGYEWWTETEEATRRPMRVRTAAEVPEEVRTAPDVQDRPKHFWAFTVYNYEAQAIQVLEIKQQTIMRAIEALVNNPKWGSPRNFDLTIEKINTGSRDLDVEYHVIPEPPSPLDEGIAELADNVPVNLDALYAGSDPFASSPEPNGREPNGKRHARGKRGTRGAYASS
jgi:hypothetical protein